MDASNYELPMKSKKSVLFEIFLSLFITAFCLYSFLYFRHDIIDPIRRLTFRAEPSETKDSPPPNTIRILFWTKIISSWHSEYAIPLADHNDTTCVFSNNRSELQRSQMVVFHFHDQAWYYHPDQEYVPPAHPEDQVWVYFTQESPAWEHNRRPKIASLFGRHINATATFLRSSDIDARYGYYLPRASSGIQPIQSKNYAANRTKQAVWLVSNCGLEKSGRMNYVKELQKYMQLDIYGKCGEVIPQCNGDSIEPCMGHLSKQYKFYIAFENSDCDDYITEKFWRNSFQYEFIPVVRGSRNNYDKLAPPRSFVQADDFASAERLAAYLKQLDQNDTLYNEYFEWKNKFMVYNNPMVSAGPTDDSMDFDQNLCRYVYEHWKERKSIDIMERFSDEKLCQSH